MRVTLSRLVRLQIRDPHVPHLRRVLLRLWNDTAWQRTEREMLELARRLLEWDGRAEELPTVR